MRSMTVSPMKPCTGSPPLNVAVPLKAFEGLPAAFTKKPASKLKSSWVTALAGVANWSYPAVMVVVAPARQRLRATRPMTRPATSVKMVFRFIFPPQLSSILSMVRIAESLGVGHWLTRPWCRKTWFQDPKNDRCGMRLKASGQRRPQGPVFDLRYSLSLARSKPRVLALIPVSVRRGNASHVSGCAAMVLVKRLEQKGNGQTNSHDLQRPAERTTLIASCRMPHYSL